jgi:hypothetical protein
MSTKHPTARAPARTAGPASPAADDAPAKPGRVTKTDILIALLRRPEGARIEDIMTATGWQAHSVRGAISGAVKKRLGLTIVSEKTDGVRVYRIVDGAAA